MNLPTYIYVPNHARAALSRLQDTGFESWLVGGFVRDSIMGLSPKDVDIATNALPKTGLELFDRDGFRSFPTGIKHGTVTVVCDANPDEPIEITTYRSDGEYLDSRHPHEVRFISAIEEDLARRDFTMNAIAYNPRLGFKDPFGGIEDIGNELIRSVGIPQKRFKEDALRILRACRFASQLGFAIENDTFDAMLSHKCFLNKIAAERISAEIEGFLLGEHIHDALMRCVDVIGFVIPELIAMKGCEQCTQYHIYDVLEHTAYVLQHTPPSRLVRWAALCHDMGKPAAAFYDESGVEHFYGHGKVSCKMAKGLMNRMLMSSTAIDDVLLLIEFHDSLKISPDATSIKRAIVKLNGSAELFEEMISLKRADALSQSELAKPRLKELDQVVEIYRDIIDNDPVFRISDLDINGSDIMDLGFEQGPAVGQALAALLDAVIEKEIPNSKEALLAYAEILRNADDERRDTL